MERYVSQEALAQLEHALPSLAGAERMQAKLTLAWHLRQRHSARALQLCQLVQQTQSERSVARCLLVQAEVKWLSGELELALQCGNIAKLIFERDQDPIGLCDASWLLGNVAHEQGQPELRNQHWQSAIEQAQLAGDSVRMGALQARLAILNSQRDPQLARQQWQQRLRHDLPGLPAALLASFQEFQGEIGIFGRTGAGLALLMQAFQGYLSHGNVQRAIIVACNIGQHFCHINDFQNALEWQQRGLHLARESAWPSSMGLCLINMGECLRCLGRLEAAQQFLQEGLQHLGALPRSTNCAIGLIMFARLQLDQDDYQQALQTFDVQQQKAAQLQRYDLESDALLGKARAHIKLGDASAALVSAQAALQLAQQHHSWECEIAAYRQLAEIYAQAEIAPPPAMTEPSATLHFLQRAKTLADSVEGYVMASELLDELADAYAAIEDFAAAFALARRARLARHSSQHHEAANRAIATQSLLDFERTQLQLQQQKQFMVAEAERAELLQQTSVTLQHLGTIGQEITAHLQPQAVFETLNRHVHNLLDAFSISIYLLDADGKSLSSHFAREGGRELAPLQIALNNADSHSVRCLLEQREILIDVPDDSDNPAWVPDTAKTSSCLFAPLMVDQRVLGVMTIQSQRRHAYHERERQIFRTLCAYGAIALDNAFAYQQLAQTKQALEGANSALAASLEDLRDTQAQLIQSEKMASLGQLVASVAHEINTPIAAIKSSSQNIGNHLRDVLLSLPPLFQQLDFAHQNLLVGLIRAGSGSNVVRSSRETRALQREISQQLEASGLSQVKRTADHLIELNCHTAWVEYLPLLQHPEAELMLTSAYKIATVLTSASNIEMAVGKVSKIVFALRSFSHVEQSEELLPHQLRDGLETVLTLYQHQLKRERGIELECEFAEVSPLMCLADELNQVWTILIHNALQAMQFQGKLKIALSQQEGQIIVAISDSGCGIAAEIRNRIFDPFFTTKALGEGSGLGLGIAKKIINKHRGRIEVDSEIGVGTTFSVYLPLEAVANR